LKCANVLNVISLLQAAEWMLWDRRLNQQFLINFYKLKKKDIKDLWGFPRSMDILGIQG
jgi:hypothetical protein